MPQPPRTRLSGVANRTKRDRGTRGRPGTCELRGRPGRGRDGRRPGVGVTTLHVRSDVRVVGRVGECPRRVASSRASQDREPLDSVLTYTRAINVIQYLITFLIVCSLHTRPARSGGPHIRVINQSRQNLESKSSVTYLSPCAPDGRLSKGHRSRHRPGGRAMCETTHGLRMCPPRHPCPPRRPLPCPETPVDPGRPDPKREWMPFRCRSVQTTRATRSRFRPLARSP